MMCGALTLTLFAGCEGNEPEIKPQGETTLTLETKSVDATADGGHFEVNYSFENPVEGA
jgi:predicted component of type VI protein secretion system